MPVGNKFGKMVAYLEVLQPIKSHDPLTRHLTRSRAKLISPVPKWLWSPNLAGWSLTPRGSST